MPNRRYEDFSLSVTIIFGFTLMALGLMIIFLTQLSNREIGKSNNTYLQTVVCISSETPIKRTPEYVKSCYDKAENSNSITINRFGGGK